MARRISRRHMILRSAAAAAGLGLGTRAASILARPAPNERLDIAFIGIGGRGRANLDALAGENVVALCDVDDARAGDAYAKHPGAEKHRDFRKMLDKLESRLDAVVVSTPDHTHFHPAMMAMRMGKHLYCEKPMAHSVDEVRAMTRLAAEKKLATQLGVQRHTLDNVHRVVEIVRAGGIGVVKECFAWVGGDRGMPAVPKDKPPVPEHLDWDLWLGPAAERPYHSEYAPYGWRFWWDFGTGETGNWGCHILDIPFWALDLGHPERVEASGPTVHAQTTPKAMDVTFRFPARGSLPALSLHWSHTKTGPAILAENKLPHFESGVLFVGSEGMLLCEFGKRLLFPEEKFKGYKGPDRTIPKSPGFHKEWILACKGGAPATCNFDYTGPMTETVLLGNVAYRAGKPFAWNAKAMQAEGASEVAALVRTEYRKGWEIATPSS